MRVTLTYFDRFVNPKGEIVQREKTFTLEGDKAGVNLIPVENPAVIQVWANTPDRRTTQGFLLSSLIAYHIDA